MVRSINFSLILVAFGCLIQSGCNIINPAEPVPTYVHIDSFLMQGNVNVTGTNSHKITNVWAYYNNNLIGVFNLPVTIPIITDGSSGRLSLAPGIDNNGFSTDEKPYAFYHSDSLRITPQPGTVINYLPTTGYYAKTQVKLNENFEGGNSFINTGGTPMTLVNSSQDTSKVFEGTRSARIVLANAGDSSVNGTNVNFTLPTTADSYLELNYKSTVNIQLGLTTTDNLGLLHTQYLIGLRPRSEWGKIYISLQSFAATYQGTVYNVLLRAGGADSGPGEVNIDNVKVVSF